MICHQCGHKIQIFSEIANVRCPKCRATYVTKPSAPLPNSHPVPTPAPVEPQNNTWASSYESFPSYQEEVRVNSPSPPTQDSAWRFDDARANNAPTQPPANDFERTTIYPVTPTIQPLPPTIPQISVKVSLRYWGVFGADFLERLKTTGSVESYKRELIRTNTKDVKQLATFKLPDKKVLIGRKPTNLQGFEDVEIKLESEDITISRRQCFIDPQVKNNVVNVMLITHANASNLTEINGVSIDRNASKVVYHGDFIRIGNSIFEVIIEKLSTANNDMNKTVIF